MAAILACAGPAAVLVWLATRQHGLVQIAGELPPHAAAGHRIAVATICACLLAGGLGALAARLAASLSVRERQLTGVGLASVAAVAVVACLVVFAPARGYPQLVSRSVHDFTQPRPLSGSRTAAYLTASGTGRWALWNVAYDEWRSSPITGTGPGDFRFWWDQRRNADFEVVNAHNLYLETLAESGIVGVLLLLLLPVGLIVAVVSLRRDGGGATVVREADVALAACTGILAHAAFDWDWQLPAVILPSVVLAFGVISAANSAGRRASAWASAYCCAVRSPGDLPRRWGHGRGRPRPRKERSGAWRVSPGTRVGQRSRSPRSRSRRTAAPTGEHPRRPRTRPSERHRLLGCPGAVPRNFITYADWASVLLARGDERAARILVKRGLTLNPRDERDASTGAARRPRLPPDF